MCRAAVEKCGLEPPSEDLAARRWRAGLGWIGQRRHGARSGELTEMGVGNSQSIQLYEYTKNRD